jgi:hypothetical protein
MAKKYTTILHRKTILNLPKLGIFGLKICHLATLLTIPTFEEHLLSGFTSNRKIL